MSNSKRKSDNKKTHTSPGNEGIIQVLNAQPPLLIFGITLVGIVLLTCCIYFGSKPNVVGAVRRLIMAPMNKVMVLDPVTLIQTKEMYTIIDIRSKDEFSKSHIKQAISVPVYRLDGAVLKLIELNSLIIPTQIDRSKPVVLYGPSAYFASTNEVASHLISQGYRVYVLSVGWNEFRHFQNIWIPEALWGTIDVMNYIQEN